MCRLFCLLVSCRICKIVSVFLQKICGKYAISDFETAIILLLFLMILEDAKCVLQYVNHANYGKDQNAITTGR